MPIIGLTDRSTRTGRIALLGQLNKGDAKGQKTKADGRVVEIVGRERPFFRYSSRWQPTSEEVFKRVYGPEPGSLTVSFLSSDINEIFPTWLEVYKGSRLLYRGDGAKAYLWWDDSAKTYQHKEIPWPFEANDPRVQHRGTLYFILPDLMREQLFGLVRLKTSSKHDLLNISNSLDSYIKLANGDITGVMFTLYRYQDEKPDPDGSRRSHWFVGLTPDIKYMLIQTNQQRQRAYQLAERVPKILDHDTGAYILDDDDDDDDDYKQPLLPGPGKTKEPATQPKTTQPKTTQPKTTQPQETARKAQSKTTNKTGATKTELIKQIDAAGTVLYGNVWDRVSGDMAAHVSNGDKTNLSSLVKAQLEKINQTLQNRIGALDVMTSDDISPLVDQIKRISGLDGVIAGGLLEVLGAEAEAVDLDLLAIYPKVFLAVSKQDWADADTDRMNENIQNVVFEVLPAEYYDEDDGEYYEEE